MVSRRWEDWILIIDEPNFKVLRYHRVQSDELVEFMVLIKEEA